MLAEDTELVSQTLAGDTEKFGEIVERYKDALYRHAYRMVRDEDEAEDIAQVAFIKAYDKLHTFDTTKKLSTWLFRIVTNTALDHLRQAKHQTPLTDELTARIVGKGISPQASAEYAELYSAVAQLSPRYQAVISLHYWEDLKIEEIASIMNVPSGSVKGWLHRAKQALKKELL